MAKMGEKKRARRSSAQREEDEKPDRLSELPDAIIHQIMSFLDIKTAIQTCILSKRWDRLWVSLPDINIDSDWYTDSSFPEFVLKVLSSRADFNVGKFRINTRLSLDYSSLDMIIEYLVSHNVEHLELYPSNERCSQESFCSLLPLRSCNSLKTLKLTNFLVDGSIEDLRFGLDLTMLTSLNLSGCLLYCNGYDSSDTLASCPNLKNLCMRDCCFCPVGVWKISGNQLLNLEIENPNGKFDIFAPKVTSLYLKARTVWNFSSLEVSSVDYAYFYFGGYDMISKRDTSVQIEDYLFGGRGLFWEGDDANLKEYYSICLINFIRGLCNAQVLSLSSEIIKDLGFALNNGEQQPSPFKRLKSLEVKCEEKSAVIPAHVKTYFLGDNPHEETVRVESSTDAGTIVYLEFRKVET